jgi:hypothetical protein
MSAPLDGEWRARILPTTVLIQSPTGALYSVKMPHPDIWAVAIWIRNRPGVYRMAKIDPRIDARHTRKYDEYRFMTFPF